MMLGEKLNIEILRNIAHDKKKITQKSNNLTNLGSLNSSIKTTKLAKINPNYSQPLQTEKQN